MGGPDYQRPDVTMPASPGRLNPASPNRLPASTSVARLRISAACLGNIPVSACSFALSTGHVQVNLSLAQAHSRVASGAGRLFAFCAAPLWPARMALSRDRTTR